jgi:hypothetical protein
VPDLLISSAVGAVHTSVVWCPASAILQPSNEPYEAPRISVLKDFDILKFSVIRSRGQIARCNNHNGRLLKELYRQETVEAVICFQNSVLVRDSNFTKEITQCEIYKTGVISARRISTVYIIEPNLYRTRPK